MSDYGSYSSKGSPTFAAFVPAYAAPLRRSSAVSSTTSIREAAPAPHATEPRVSLNARILHLFRASHRLFAPPQPVTPSPAPSLLHDVIANKHLSPLSLHDFQEHLRTARSLENLEFIIWLAAYEKEWKAYQADPRQAKLLPLQNLNTDPFLASRRPEHLPDHLIRSLRRGLDTFLRPDAALELNLSQGMRDKTLVQAGNSGDPHDFAEVKEVIENSLNRSLASHTRNCQGEALLRRSTT